MGRCCRVGRRRRLCRGSREVGDATDRCTAAAIIMNSFLIICWCRCAVVQFRRMGSGRGSLLGTGVVFPRRGIECKADGFPSCSLPPIRTFPTPRRRPPLPPPTHLPDPPFQLHHVLLESLSRAVYPSQAPEMRVEDGSDLSEGIFGCA